LIARIQQNGCRNEGNPLNIKKPDCPGDLKDNLPERPKPGHTNSHRKCDRDARNSNRDQQDIGQVKINPPARAEMIFALSACFISARKDLPSPHYCPG
jgi:hypothetical protein